MKILIMTISLILMLSGIFPMGNSNTQMSMEEVTYKSSVMPVNDEQAIQFDSHKTEKMYINMMPKSVQTYLYLEKWASYWKVPMTIVLKMTKLETGYDGPNDKMYNPSLISSANAYGCMQELLSTAKFMWDGDKEYITRERLLTDLELNIYIGIKYIKYLYNTYHDWTIACGYYNTGYPIVNDYARVATEHYR